MSNAQPFRPHNHSHCVDDAMHRAEVICQDAGARLTPLRQRVLRMIWQSHKPLGAYDLLAIMNEDGGKAAPPTVYRALDFLQQMGLVHRIASLNAFVGCSHPEDRHDGCFLICETCSNILELPARDIHGAIDQTTRLEGFRITRTTVEIAGVCPACQQGESP